MNRRHTAYEAAALTTELHRLIISNNRRHTTYDSAVAGLTAAYPVPRTPSVGVGKLNHQFTAIKILIINTLIFIIISVVLSYSKRAMNLILT